MDLKDYQLMAYNNIKPHETEDMEKADYALGLAGEAGEVVELIKHQVMHKEEIDLVKLAKELGDVCWYVAAIATTYGINLQTVAELNLSKLQHRYQRKYSQEGSVDRKEKEKEFSSTVEYQHIISKLKFK